MILKALYDYYHNCGTLPPRGMERKELTYIIVIDRAGQFVRFESKRIDKKRSASFLVAKGVGRTSAPKSNILWDNGKYVFGFEPSHLKCYDLFVSKVRDIAKANSQDTSIQALNRFYDTPKDVVEQNFEQDPLFSEIKDNLSCNFSFQVEGDDKIIAEKTELYINLLENEDEDDMTGICLITGNKGPLVRLTTATPIPGNSPMAALVGMQKDSGYDSYGKTQAYNAPISKEAEFAYTAALKRLLDKDSKNKAKIGERTFLFWGSGNQDLNDDIVSGCTFLWGFDTDKTFDPNEKITKVRELFKSIWSGKIKTTLDDRFYILGLAPNTGRIAVVSWSEMALTEFAEHILAHFNDMDIVDMRPVNKRKPYYGIFAILSAVTLGGKVSDSQPNLAETLLNAVLHGTAYPFALYSSVLERIRAELSDISVTTARAAIIKAYLNRKTKNQSHIKPISTMLDKTNDSPGYLCGRLVAVLEKVQDDVRSGDSIRTRYMAAASATPSAVFPAMLNVSVHHSEKLSEGSRIYYEQLKQEILDKLPSTGFPSHLDLNEQGRFFVGYYHQRADLYTKKETKE